MAKKKARTPRPRKHSEPKHSRAQHSHSHSRAQHTHAADAAHCAEADAPAPHEHRHAAPGAQAIGIRVITVSDTRSLDDDKSGALLEELFHQAGHPVTRALVRDDRTEIAHAISIAEADPSVRAIVLTGGTGVSRRDVTAELVSTLLEKELPGFGEIFRALSFEEIGSAAYLSRAIAGVRGTRALFALPGSRAAVRLAATRLIVPELAHLIRELDK